jgi:hypothetical protein
MSMPLVDLQAWGKKNEKKDREVTEEKGESPSLSLESFKYKLHVVFLWNLI